jgi:hypothetical protein
MQKAYQSRRRYSFVRLARQIRKLAEDHRHEGISLSATSPASTSATSPFTFPPNRPSSPPESGASTASAADAHHLTTVDLKLDQAFLSSLTASRRAELVVRVESSRQPLAERKIEVNLLPPGTGQNDANSRQQ